MAIYHFSAQIISRSAGRSAVAAAAYRSGERLHDQRYGDTHDYTKKVVAEHAIATPDHAPDWMKDRSQLWNAVEQKEKRKDAQLCREINVALPSELSPKEQKTLLSHFVTDQFVKRGMVADMAIHRNDESNPHAHIMLTMREVTSEGFGNKVREWNDKELLEKWREEWANYANKALERANVQDRIDHRSLADQGKELQPTIHLGHQAHAMEKRGIKTERGDVNRAVAEYNRAVVSLEGYRRERQALEKKTPDRPLSEPQKAMSFDERYGQLVQKRNQIVKRMNQIHPQLQDMERKLRRVGDLRKLQERREVSLQRLEEIRPKNLWQSFKNPHKQEIQRLENSVEAINRTLKEQMPAPKEITIFQEQHSMLNGALKAVEVAYKEIQKEVDRMDNERRMKQGPERTRQRQRKQRDMDRDR